VATTLFRAPQMPLSMPCTVRLYGRKRLRYTKPQHLPLLC
jgi:hypothetical protein